jgi:hypothetical protein
MFRGGLLPLVLGAILAYPRATGAAAAPMSASNHGGRFELVTYNVAGLPEGISRSRPLANLPRIGELLNAFDIALVQEDFAYPLELRRALRHPHASSPFERSGRLDFGDGLSQFSRWPFTNFRREAWISCHGLIDSFFDCLTPKGFSMSRQSIGRDASVHVYNLHMDAGWSPDDRAAREGQVEQLIAAIRRQSPGQAVIVGGDTNLWGRDRRLLDHLMSSAGLSDACAETRCPEPSRIDRVLFRRSRELRLRPRRWRIAGEFVDDARRPLSDHLAVAVEFEWEREPREP